MALDATAKIMGMGYPVYSPIVHGHPVAARAGIHMTDHDFWMKVDAPMMESAKGIIVYMATGWEESRGMAHEIKEFVRMRKPILHIQPFFPEHRSC
ncbi:hypothetical protein Aam_030_061 [Acidocella aminolytica 101 = DSM 11237]|uniref:DUF1937 domain-containing protein n=2 Tax=Acidocella TaxID=50709 RepID=A0A0D6PF46_9PROT|nr:hypothetical protein Aam_030_061 [Acidocella aminolytica 101 = DSM 11237]GBQ31973.1 hypothetical protein AA11237_0027 [Acidocella aminolytica 101 = DSM 11237]